MESVDGRRCHVDMVARHRREGAGSGPGRADDGVAFFEWSCADDLDPVDPASWPQYHPAYGRTIGDAALEAALDILGPDEFARAYGNRWVSTVSPGHPARGVAGGR